MFIPETADIDALLRVKFSGPSLALITGAGGKPVVRCGAAANSVLEESRRNATDGLWQSNGSGWGLLLVHSHRQRASEFELHARMLELSVRTQPSGGLLHELSLLIVNNDAAELLPHGPWHGSSEDPVQWLRAYTSRLQGLHL